MYSRILASYIPQDHDDFAERILDEFRKQIDRHLRLDFRVIANIAEWQPVLEREIIQCDAIIIIIGPRWLTVFNQMSDDDNYLYFEIASALRHDKIIVPIYIKGTLCLSAENLPEGIGEFLEYPGTYLEANDNFLQKSEDLASATAEQFRHRKKDLVVRALLPVIERLSNRSLDDLSLRWLLTDVLEDRDMDQKSLARLLGISEATLGRMLHGERIPKRVGEVYQIGQKLGYSEESDDMKTLIVAFLCDWLRKLFIDSDGN
jgi:hypothetical protein